jgi:TetR/AcrR family acrAB operon transcriptional repressor
MTKSDNEIREQRILDAAGTLFVHYGYDKTTVSDMARQAGISKGAIYLHFDSKEALLEALIAREMAAYAEKWLALIDADPRGGTIGSMYKNSLYALSESEFMAAMFRQDGRILGNYLRKPDNLFMQMRNSQEQSERYLFVKLMQDAGVMRGGVDAQVVAHIMDMLAYGLVGMDDFIPPEKRPSLADIIEGIAVMMDAAFTPDDVDSEKGKQILQQIADAGRQQFDSMEK